LFDDCIQPLHRARPGVVREHPGAAGLREPPALGRIAGALGIEAEQDGVAAGEELLYRLVRPERTRPIYCDCVRGTLEIFARTR
jgi:hypothetical protein